uniref:Lipolytic enzyme, G-D-S-L n=1 Tax=uncultured haloarchaeon TaxID=160804 RepID=A5YSQ3_9EURY|nr:lipolytic enzyme, G-D-S-L [uncultured haloarchaeon]
MTTERDPLRVFFFGDSICFGQGVALHKGWVPRISAELSDCKPKSDRETLVINSAVNGDTTRKALERMGYDVQSHGVDIIVIQFGMNDCNIWESNKGLPRVSPDSFETNLEEIVTRARNFGARRVFLHTNHPTLKTDPLPNTEIPYEWQNQRYNEIIRNVANRDNDIVLHDVESKFREKIQESEMSLNELVLPDNLHLSEQGHDLYFEFVLPQIQAAVQQLLDE